MDEPTTIADLERRLAESEARHRLLIESWAQAEWETDAAGVVTVDSPSWRAYTGQTLKEWLENGWLNAIHPDDRAYAESQWREAVAAHRFVNAEFRLRAPDGGWRWTNVCASPVLNTEGIIEKWVGVNINIDDRKRAETALRESELKYRSLFETLGQGYAECELIRGPDGHATDLRYIMLNPALERLSGLKVSETIGRTAREAIPGIESSQFEMYEQIVAGGVPVRVEYETGPLARWYEVYVYPSVGDRFFTLYEDITERKRAETRLRESEDRQSFLLALGDGMRSQPTASSKIRVAARLLGERLNASRILYAEYDWERGLAHIFNGWFADGAQPFPVVMQLQDYDGQVLHDLKAGRTVRVDNVGLLADQPGFAAIAEVGVQALLSPPLMIDGKLAMNVSVHQHEPRHWNDAEVALVQEVAERLWAEVVRARAEAALKESEERFQQFAKASAAGLWIRDAGTLAMEFVSPAIGSIYGINADAILGDVKHWASMIVPEDRDRALRHVEEARGGASVAHEFRIRRPSDETFRWIRNTDFPLRDNGYISRVGGIAEDITEAKLAVEHQGVLLAELQHRVRNIMGVIRSMANRTAPGAKDVADYRVLLEGRLLALARVQTLLTREANAGGSLRSVLESEIAAQAHHGGQYELTGQQIRLSPKAVEVLTLAFHELSTNAHKYGALSVPDGRLTVRWSPFEKRGRPWLALDWIEQGAPQRPPSTRRGFGSELIEARIPYELSGRGAITIDPEGARCHLEFPLEDGESILETDAPKPATTFGGSLDMTGAPDLTGRTILVVEDDYYLATDTASALQAAGAKVLGPCPNEEAVRDLLEDECPTHAVLDLNLGGGGPRFDIAHVLRARGVPFVFLTGYDPDVIPEDLAGIMRLQKPLPFRDIVKAVGQL